MDDSETLLDQLVEDLQELFNNDGEYSDLKVKDAYTIYPEVTYPMVVIEELENSDNRRYFDGEEHIINVGYQFTILAEQSTTKTAKGNVRSIIRIIRDYMRGERYKSLQRFGPTPITKKQGDDNVSIGYMRYIGCIDKDTHTIYRRN